MAIDFTGMFTGKRPDPSVVSNQPPSGLGPSAQASMQVIQQGEQRAKQGLSGMFGTDFRSPAEQVKEQLVQLDRNKLEDQPKIVELLRRVDPQASFAAEEIFKQQNAQKEGATQQRAALITMARTSEQPQLVTWLEAGGDLKEAKSVLLKKPEQASPMSPTTMYEDGKLIKTALIGGKLHKATENGWSALADNAKLSSTAPSKGSDRTATLTKAGLESFESLLKANPDIKEKLTVDGWFLMGKAETKTNIRNLFIKANEIYTSNPDLGKEEALRRASEIAKPDGSNASASSDKYDNAPIRKD